MEYVETLWGMHFKMRGSHHTVTETGMKSPIILRLGGKGDQDQTQVRIKSQGQVAIYYAVTSHMGYTT